MTAADHVRAAIDELDSEWVELRERLDEVSDVKGSCPMCGGSLFLGSGGYVTCSRSDCPNPTAVSDLLTDHTERHHVVVLRDDSFSIQHPIRERLDGSLLTCGLHEELSDASGPPLRTGTYHVHGDGRSAAWQCVSGPIPAPVADEVAP